MKTGFIGLGNLGLAIAENLVETQKPLYVYNRTASKAKSLVDKGAVLCKSVKELAAQCDVVFTIVSEDNALNEIANGAEGLIANLKKGAIHVSLSTILPETSKALHAEHLKNGSQYLDCPVMARPEAARARKIGFLISGDKLSIEKVKPLLEEAGAAKIWEFSDEIGSANVAKLASNYLILAAMEALAEGINLTRKANIDTELWMKMLTESYFSAPVYINYSKLIMQEAFDPAAFSLRLGLKDITLVNKLADSVNANMPVGKKIQSVLQRSLDDGLGELDVTAISLTIKDQKEVK